MGIIVLGSINMDLVARTPRLPAPGETLTGHSFATIPGGKGGNQAVACARLDAPTRLLGRVGNDAFGHALLDSLRQNKVDTRQIAVDPTASSGVAVIAVDDNAENSIIVIPGANGRVGRRELDNLGSVLRETDLLLLQLEIPMDTVEAAARLALQRGARVLLDPAPARPLPDDLYPLVDTLTPNLTEAAILSGRPVHDHSTAVMAAQDLLARGAGQVIVKMGSSGAYAIGPEGGEHYPAIPVEAVDTVAAGDAFNGALAVALAEGRPWPEAIHWALAGGACAVTAEGAQPSMPDRETLLAMLAKR